MQVIITQPRLNLPSLSCVTLVNLLIASTIKITLPNYKQLTAQGPGVVSLITS